ncbi:MAG: phage integrase N-terminal SAM-like domain-containing protein [Gammaproteobacteria bacterium]
MLDQVRDVIRRLHYSIRTGRAYVAGSGASYSTGRGEPRIGAVEVEAFLTQLALQGQVASPTQNQALNAIVFLYRRNPLAGPATPAHGAPRRRRAP